jgi:quinol monooxygenase YgiN
MYGTIFRMKVKSGQEQRVIEIFRDWERDQQPVVKGALGGVLMKPDASSGEFIGVAIFQDKESYLANADNPAQQEWFGRLREALEADPEWEDGEYIAGSLG